MANTRAGAKRNVTLADVARYANVSSAVVSYVVNDGPRPVAVATAQRVRNAIDTLGYRPNSHARALVNGTTGILGLIHPGTWNPFFGEFNDVLYETAARHGLALLTTCSAGSAATERQLLEELTRRSVDGIIVISSMTPADVPHLHNPGLPMQFLNCPFPVPGHRTIGPDGLSGTRQLIEHLVADHGYQDVALIAGLTSAKEPEDRELAWGDALRTRGLTPGRIVRTTFDMDGGYEAATRLLDNAQRPDAIFASSDMQAYGALHAIHEHGLQIPGDIAVVSFDGNSESAHTWPPLTVVRQPVANMAEAAVNGILNSTGPRHDLFEMELIIRRSCGCQAD